MNTSSTSPNDRSGNPDEFNATYEEMLDKAEADVELLRRAVQRRKKALRRQNRRKALTGSAVYGRPAIATLGFSFFTTGIVMLATHQPSEGLDMIDRALTAWSILLGLPPRT